MTSLGNFEEREPVGVSVVMPCLNEEQGIASCIEKAYQAFQQHGLRGEVIVSDNGSTDRSAEIALSKGARVVHEFRRGYGSALRRGIQESRGRYIVIGDADNSYDFTEIDRLLLPLQNGYDLVIGSRFRGRILRGAMPWTHEYIGNPILTSLLNLLFGLRVSDAQSGLRAFTKEAYERMSLQAAGMEFASEMLIAAQLLGLRITEVPVSYHPRVGASKLRPLPDAWRHIRLIFLQRK